MDYSLGYKIYLITKSVKVLPACSVRVIFLSSLISSCVSDLNRWHLFSYWSAMIRSV